MQVNGTTTPSSMAHYQTEKQVTEDIFRYFYIYRKDNNGNSIINAALGLQDKTIFNNIIANVPYETIKNLQIRTSSGQLNNMLGYYIDLFARDINSNSLTLKVH